MRALPLKIMLAHIIRRYNKNEKQNKIHIVATIPKSNIKIVERGKPDIPSTQIHGRSQYMAAHSPWLGTDTSITIMAGIN